jgi:hypothetical protein
MVIMFGLAIFFVGLKIGKMVQMVRWFKWFYGWLVQMVGWVNG